MPGRVEDPVWRCFIKAKPDGKKYYCGTCKGCGDVFPGVHNFLFGELFKLHPMQAWWSG
jgi:hypothetical protein